MSTGTREDRGASAGKSELPSAAAVTRGSFHPAFAIRLVRVRDEPVIGSGRRGIGFRERPDMSLRGECH